MMRAALLSIILTACAAPYTVQPGEPVVVTKGYGERCVPEALVKQITSRLQESFAYMPDYYDEWKNLTVDMHVGEARGDCEDFAYTVQAQLLNIGYQPHTARMALTDEGRHAVLVVQTCTSGQMVVDNWNRGAVVGIDYYAPERWHAIEHEGAFAKAVKVR